MGQLLEQLGNKDAGHLIRHADWNQLVAAVDGLSELVTAKLAALEAQTAALATEQTSLRADVTSVGETVEKMEARMVAVEEDLAQLNRDYYKLALSTTQLNYPIGTLAVIDAQVTDLRGDPLDLAEVAARPWVDFVSSWGLIKPEPGFVSRGGVGDRTLSVQVNENGLARVRVRAEHGDGIPADEESQVGGSLPTMVPNQNLSVQKILMEAQTPMEASQRGAFKIMAAEYDRENALSVRNYVDAAYQRLSPRLNRNIIFQPAHTWRDYRATIMAFVKADSDPTTADHGRAQSTIQVTFRDWVSPFVELDYLGETTKQKDNLRLIFEANVSESFESTIARFKGSIKEVAADKGWLGRQRNLRAAVEAIDQFQMAQPPQYLATLKQSVKDAVNMQQTLDKVQLSSADGNTELALDIFTNSSVRADMDTALIKSDFTKLKGDFSEVQNGFLKVKELEKEVLKFDVREEVSQLRKDFQTTNTDVRNLSEKVVRLDVTVDLGRLKGEVTRLDGDVRRFGQDFTGVNSSIAALNQKTQAVQSGAEQLTARQATLEGQLVNLRALNVTEVTSSLGNVNSLLNRVAVLERR